MLWNKEVCLGGWPMTWLEGTVLKYLFRARGKQSCVLPPTARTDSVDY
jgi:hypothetical protein